MLIGTTHGPIRSLQTLIAALCLGATRYSPGNCTVIGRFKTVVLQAVLLDPDPSDPYHFPGSDLYQKLGWIRIHQKQLKTENRSILRTEILFFIDLICPIIYRKVIGSSVGTGTGTINT